MGATWPSVLKLMGAIAHAAPVLTTTLLQIPRLCALLISLRKFHFSSFLQICLLAAKIAPNLDDLRVSCHIVEPLSIKSMATLIIKSIFVDNFFFWKFVHICDSGVTFPSSKQQKGVFSIFWFKREKFHVWSSSVLQLEKHKLTLMTKFLHDYNQIKYKRLESISSQGNLLSDIIFLWSLPCLVLSEAFHHITVNKK